MSKYFIVRTEALGEYGSELGCSKEEAEQMLADSYKDEPNLVVINGEIVEPKFVLPTPLLPHSISGVCVHTDNEKG